MGLDVGTKRIGLAISDSDRLISFPYKVVEFNKGIAGVRTEVSLDINSLLMRTHEMAVA